MTRIIQGDCLDVLKTLESESVDSVVTDPPYGIGFMGKAWDTFKPEHIDKVTDVPTKESWRGRKKEDNLASSRASQAGLYDLSLKATRQYQDWCYDWAVECLRVLKPGGHLLVSNSSRMYHRMACAIEDAGFEIRDMISWNYGSGFPKSLNIHKKDNRCPEGWGTALKPAHEPIVVARKPLSEKTVAQNVLKWGTGGINIDGCRVGTTESDKYDLEKREVSRGSGIETNINFTGRDLDLKHGVQNTGRFPANFIHDGSKEVVEKFPETKSGARKGKNNINSLGERVYGKYGYTGGKCESSEGSASRFFYCAKASKSERNAGCDGMEEKQIKHGLHSTSYIGEKEYKTNTVGKNNHPTVKPVSLMRYLCKLITPVGGTVLDPFTGSGTTGIGAKLEGFKFIGIEREEDYCRIAEARIKAWQPEIRLL